MLILGQPNKELAISGKVYDLIYELNHICPTVLLAVLPQLEFKLKSSDEKERLGAVSLLARMFSEKDSTLAIHHRPLWQAFLGRSAVKLLFALKIYSIIPRIKILVNQLFFSAENIYSLSKYEHKS